MTNMYAQSKQYAYNAFNNVTIDKSNTQIAFVSFG